MTKMSQPIIPLKNNPMKTQIIIRRLYHFMLIVIVYMALTSCGDKSDENQPEEDHCTSANSITRTFNMNYENYQYTYYCYKEGDYIILRYFSEDYSGICPDKLITLDFYCELSKNQPKPVQVIAYIYWGNNVNVEEPPLEKEIVDQSWVYSWKGNIDLSSYYLTGGAADMSLKIDFKFISSGDNFTDQKYLKSLFETFFFILNYYPY
jgi:hypothetical protein